MPSLALYFRMRCGRRGTELPWAEMQLCKFLYLGSASFLRPWALLYCMADLSEMGGASRVDRRMADGILQIEIGMTLLIRMGCMHRAARSGITSTSKRLKTGVASGYLPLLFSPENT